MQRICFLYIDEPYNIFHSIGIAINLYQNPDVEVEILCTERNYKYTLDILQDNKISDLEPKIVRPFWHYTLPHYIEIKLQHRYFLYRKYKKTLNTYDGIVCSLYNDLLLRQFINAKPKLIFSGHGIANRFPYSYDDKIKSFDFILLAGEMEKAIRQSLHQLQDGNNLVVGYPKYELCKSLSVNSPFENDKPIILYNPHWLKAYSSFYTHGLSILEYFSQQSDYNLIFAPHSLLTTRNKSILTQISRYENSKNIHIDTGSISCHNMTYLKLADIYIGDISSQALEFSLIRRRPCLFIVSDTKLINQDDFHSLSFGDVIDSLFDIETLLCDLENDYEKKYKAIQDIRIQKLFKQSETPASQIAAEGIYNYLSGRSNS